MHVLLHSTCFPHCGLWSCFCLDRSKTWLWHTRADWHDGLRLSNELLYVDFLSIHVFKLTLVAYKGWVKWKMLKIACNHCLHPVFWALRMMCRRQTQILVFYRLFLLSLPPCSPTAVMLSVRQLLFRCHWNGFVITVAQDVVGFNTSHMQNVKVWQSCVHYPLSNWTPHWFLISCTAANVKCHSITVLPTLCS